MRIVMMTNTYLPHIGGVARSVTAFSAAYRRLGHEVLVVAPEFEDRDPQEENVVRVPAIQNFNGSDFSLILPVSGTLDDAIVRFEPQIIHSHHPFLVGSAALRLACQLALPLVFTHHTMYEEYTHYVPGDSPLLKRFVATLSSHYANACQRVFAPSASIATLIQERGVTTPIEVIPTGIGREFFDAGDGPGLRAALGIPPEAFVVGHVGRLAPEKNLDYLGEALMRFLLAHPQALALVVGGGPCASTLRALAREAGIEARLVMTGSLDHPLLASAYRAMDVFAFASKSETQGLVLAEALAVGVPVVALDAPGAREVVVDGDNGRLLDAQASVADFVAALAAVAALDAGARAAQAERARATARDYDIDRCAERALAVYAELAADFDAPSRAGHGELDEVIARLGAEWTVLKGLAGAAGAALVGSEPATTAASG
ncbi:MAG TPA: glycosyltransferase [Gammaproteobacteria bacterium]|nr:glycosyltransferase [Gammaproteobacteria bacterium]